jgi:hypothetical protein
MSTDIKLIFRNINNETIEANITLHNSPITDKWKPLFKGLLQSKNTEYVKTFSLVGGFSQNRKPEQIVHELVDGVKLLKNAEWYPEYDKINEDFESLLHTFDREMLNNLHHHFDQLQGQFWNPTSFLSQANGEERFAISKLNLCCHELEAYYDSLDNKKNNIDHSLYFYYSVANIPHYEKITLDDKMSFTRNISNGMVYLHYAQTGKTWYEAYTDEDEIVPTENITEHRTISGEFSCHIGPEFEMMMGDGFKKYITDRGKDPNDPSLAIGYCPIGKLESVDGISIDNYNEVQKLLEEYDDLFAVEYDGVRREYIGRANDDIYYKSITDIMNSYTVNAEPFKQFDE